MNHDQRLLLGDVMTRYQTGRLTRRQALRLLGALGLTALGAAKVAGSAGAAMSRLQPAGTPVAPPLGPRADGTNLWKVLVGGMDMANDIHLHGFFPGEVTINAGDAIWFDMAMPGFHTVTFTSGAAAPSIIVPDVVDGVPVTVEGGLPKLILNSEVIFPAGGDRYDGTGYLNSGADVFRTPDQGPYVVTFTQPGTYDYVCVPHETVMKGRIVVQDAGAARPYDLAAFEAMAADQIAKLVADGKALIDQHLQATTEPKADGTTTWDVAAGLGGDIQARVLRFLPGDVTIKVGDTVRWANRPAGEPHTVTFLGGEEQPEDTIVEPQPAGPPKFVQSYRTLLPAGDATFDGVGFRNSGFIGLAGAEAEQLGLGDSYELTFTKPGEYPYYCILHAAGPEDAEGGMVGKVIVTA